MDINQDIGRLQQVEAEIIFRKLASAGIVPQTEKQAQHILQVADRLYAADRDGSLHKTASAVTGRADPFEKAASDLDRLLGANRPRVQPQQFAKAAAADPDLFNSVLRLKAHEAETIKQQWAAQVQA